VIQKSRNQEVSSALNSHWKG